MRVNAQPEVTYAEDHEGRLSYNIAAWSPVDCRR